MIRLKIDNTELTVNKNTTVLAAARQAGIEIPAMCFNEEAGAFASCMICIVKDMPTGKLLPSCSVMAENGMEIITYDEEVKKARQTALELLLSDHLGDCVAPCQVSCPAHMDIPLMNRLLTEGKMDEALKIVIRDIPIPSVLGRICPAPCESACRRKSVDEPVSICLLKRFAGDYGKIKEETTSKEMITGKKVAIIGAGPAGLSAAYYLSLAGYYCSVYDRNEKPGGMLRYGIDEENLPYRVLDKEINGMLKTGIEFRSKVTVDKKMFSEFVSTYDAILIATGELNDNIRSWPVELDDKGIMADKKSFQTAVSKVFAVGSILRPSKMAVRSVGQGKDVAVSIQQFLEGKEVTGPAGMFNSRFGRLMEIEISEYLRESVPGNQVKPVKGIADGFNLEEVKKEAARCLHCDCRDKESCKLRIFAYQYGANQRRFISETRKYITKQFIHELVVYEPEKCIKCGICVRLTEKYREKYGFTYIGRGFDVKIGIPFGEDLRESLAATVEKIAKACPTGALAMV